MTVDVAPTAADRAANDRPGRRRADWTFLRAPAIAAVLGALSWIVAFRVEFDPLSPLAQPALKATAVFAIGVVLLARLLSGPRFDALLADASAALVGVFCSFAVAIALHGTPWSLYGLNGDQQFRTEQITHFASTWQPDDFAYKGLPGFYPPLFPWLLGRAADLTGFDAWRTVRPFEIVMALLVPVAGYLLWRRLVAPWAAVGVTAVVSLLAANPVKPDEWMVLAVLVPWWFDAFRGVRRDGVRAWPAWVHGILAGLLLLAYTFYFVPVALATLAGLAVDWWRGRPLRPTLLRGAWIVGVGLVVSAVFWLPTALYHLRGHPFENTQFQWNDATTVTLPSPLEFSVAGLVMTAGLVYLGLCAYRDRVAETLAVLTASVYLFYVIGFWLAALHHPILVFHAEPLLRYGLLAAGAVGAAAAAGWLRSRSLTPAVAVLVSAAVLYSATETYVGAWVTGRPVEAAHSTRLPTGGHTRYDPPGANKYPGSGIPDSGPSAEQMYDVVMAGHPHSWRPVVLTAREDLPTLYPMYTFLHWASIYSNGFARYRDRAAFLGQLSRQTDPAEFARQARENEFDPIDVFVLRVDGGRLEWNYAIDNYPNRLAYHTIAFSRSQFDPRHFTVTEVGGYFVAAYT
jgi:galactan 5-O-arabinofuranosyltransferase